MPKNPKIAGQILSVGGERAVLLGETLADALDLDTWELAADTTPTRTPEEDAERRAWLAEWERSIKANPPKRIA